MEENHLHLFLLLRLMHPRQHWLLVVLPKLVHLLPLLLLLSQKCTQQKQQLRQHPPMLLLLPLPLVPTTLQLVVLACLQQRRLGLRLASQVQEARAGSLQLQPLQQQQRLGLGLASPVEQARAGSLQLQQQQQRLGLASQVEQARVGAPHASVNAITAGCSSGLGGKRGVTDQFSQVTLLLLLLLLLPRQNSPR
jgi:hypothetical protein